MQLTGFSRGISEKLKTRAIRRMPVARHLVEHLECGFVESRAKKQSYNKSIGGGGVGDAEVRAGDLEEAKRRLGGGEAADGSESDGRRERREERGESGGGSGRGEQKGGGDGLGDPEVGDIEGRGGGGSGEVETREEEVVVEHVRVGRATEKHLTGWGHSRRRITGGIGQGAWDPATLHGIGEGIGITENGGGGGRPCGVVTPTSLE